MRDKITVAVLTVGAFFLGLVVSRAMTPAPSPPDMARYALELRLVEAATELGETAHQHGLLCREVYRSLGLVEPWRVE